MAKTGGAAVSKKNAKIHIKPEIGGKKHINEDLCSSSD